MTSAALRLDSRATRILGALLALAFAGALLLPGLSSFGIWDPWELDAADAARRLADGRERGRSEASTWLVSLGFQWLGTREWAGRLPIALAGLVTVALALALVARAAGLRAGVYAAVITATSPLFLFNARAMLGEAPGFALQTAIALAGLTALSPRERAGRAERVALWALWLALVGAGVVARGALIGALPPVAALAVLALVEGRARVRRGLVDAVGGWLASGTALALVAAIAWDVAADRSGYSPWLGGEPRPGAPPSFEIVLERIFHAFAPWSALLPLALARVWTAPRQGSDGSDGSDGQDERTTRALGLFAVAWAGAGYGAQTLYLSRYGSEITFLPVVALAAAVALLLRDLERSRESLWGAALAAALLAGLLLRDYALYPAGPVAGLPVREISVPKVFNPKEAWAGLLGAFALAALLAFGAGSERAPAPLSAPYRALATAWRHGKATKAWLGALAAMLLALVVLGIVAWSAPDALRMSTRTARWCRALAAVPVALPLVVAATQLVLRWHSRLRDARAIGVLLAGAALGGYAVFGFMPRLSAHFSPREVYETYNALAGRSEPLGEYRVGGRAAAYYAKGEVREIEKVSELVDHLHANGRRWAVFPADELAEVDRAFRRRADDHLFVVDARSARVVLATNHALPGRENENFLVTSVVSQTPPVQHPVAARFEEHVELVGYDLDFPHDGYVGAGEHFEITWVFRCLKTLPGDYKIFVHVDGQGQRIHGDHHPIDGKYPARMWDVGDVILDRQRLEVPASYRSGSYEIFLGFYAGERRLPVTEGPEDDADRVRAGVLRIR